MKALFNKVDLWHNRLGHISKEYLVKMKERELCYGMDFNKNDALHLCHGCAKGNVKRSSVRKNIDVEKADIFIAKRPLDKLHFDTCGPFEVLSRENIWDLLL